MTETSKNSSTAELRAALSYTRVQDEKRTNKSARLETMPDRRRRGFNG